MIKNKPDDRRNNVNRIQDNISNTIENFHLAKEAIEETDDRAYKKTLEAKNERRKDSIKGMKSEMKDESIAKKNGYE